MGILFLIIGLLVMACTGCGITGYAKVQQKATTTVVNADGSTEERVTESKVSAMGDAKQVVEKLRASNGKTHSLGTEGVSEETSSKGLTDLLKGVFEAGIEVGKKVAPVPVPK